MTVKKKRRKDHLQSRWEVGNGGCTFEEYKSHFSLWCIMAAPLIAGNDIRDMSRETMDILLNTEVIAVDQDPAGIQGQRIRDDGDLEVWMKPLGSENGSEKAVLLFNRGGGTANMSVTWSEIGLSGSPAVRDLWAHQDLGSYPDSFSATVPSHGVVMVTIGGSGSTITPTPTQVPTATPTHTPGPSNLGDVNNDGSIDIIDALLIAQFYVGLVNIDTSNADTNCDGNVDIIDALLIAQYYVGLMNQFC